MQHRRVLIVLPFGIGDLLFLTPVFRALRLSPRVERVDLLLGSRSAEVVASNPHIDHIYPFDKDKFRSMTPIERLSSLRQMHKEFGKAKYDLMLDYSNRPEYALWGWLLGIRTRIGFKSRGGRFFLSKGFDFKKHCDEDHRVNAMARLAEAAGFPVDDRFLEFYVSDKARSEAETWLQENSMPKRFAVIAPGGGESWGKDAHFKQWPLDRFAMLAERTQGKVDAVLVAGSGKESPLAEELCKKIKGLPAISTAGRFSLDLTAALLERAALFIGNDGGLMHLAHALKVPVVAFFGPVDPKVYGPFPPGPDSLVIVKENLACRPCYRKFRYQSDCPDRQCLQGLDIKEFESRFQEFLEKKVCP